MKISVLLTVLVFVAIQCIDVFAQSPRLLIGDNDHNQIVMSKPDGSNLDTLDFGGMSFSFYDADVNPVNQRIYMAWYYGVYSMNYDGSDLDTLFAYPVGNYSSGITVDPANGILYWNSMPDGEIYRSNLTATEIDTILTTTGNLGDIDLDLITNKLYFGQWNGTENGVFITDADGSNSDTIVYNYDSQHLGLDMANEVIYFGDGLTCRKINYDQTNDVFLFSFYPGGFLVDTANAKLYASSISGNNIQVSNLDGSAAVDLFPMGTLNAPFGPVLIPYTLAEIEVLPMRKSELSIYPNPASDQIRISGINQPSDVFIYNVLGELVLTTNVVRDAQIDISGLSNGTYTIVTESEGMKSTGTIVVKK